LTFNGVTGNIGRRSIQWYIRFYKGKFEITDKGDLRTVRLQYQVFSTIDTIAIPIIICCPLVIGVVNHESFGYVAAAVFAALAALNFFTLYFTAKNMLSDILF
ncbi:MAG TPA: hypothetical protein VHS53_01295, partial [Mucilaginibacter sp.]|nr:hypothetical protein [Mucilaginibacter sp.]